MQKYLKIYLLFCACMFVTLVQAQNYTVKSVNLQNNDLYARKNIRYDVEGTPCAVVKLNIVGVEDLQFPDAIGDIKYSLGEYVIYVPENLSSFKFYNIEKTIEEEIKFEDWGFYTIEKQQVYRIVLDSDNKMRVAIFSIYPQNANLRFNGKDVELDNMGMAVVEEMIGEYPFEISAEGYNSISEKLVLKEEEITSISNIVLQPTKYQLTLSCNEPEATLYIDNVSQGLIDSVSYVDLTEGKHLIRIVAPKCYVYEKQITVDGDVKLDVELSKMRQQVVRYRKERSRTRASIRPSYYVIIGFESNDRNNQSGSNIKLGVNFCNHFAGIGEVCYGLGLGYMSLNDISEDEVVVDSVKSIYGPFVDLPLQIGIGIPFGKYNKHFFSVLGGVYGRACLYEDKIKETTDNIEKYTYEMQTLSSDKDMGFNFDYGLRASMRLDISSFSIGFDFSNSLNDCGIYSGMSIGFKFY